MTSTPSLITLTLTLTTFLLSEALTPAAAPGPTPTPINLIAILTKGGQYATFLRLLTQTRVDVQIQSQLNNSYSGLTVFAPTDNAFDNLKPGTLNRLSTQDQVTLLLYHVLPKYYDFATFPTATNPVPTQASGHDGVYGLNITGTTDPQVNVSTGLVKTRIGNGIYSTFPLSVFSVDMVLLPYQLFGEKTAASAPVKAEGPSSSKDDSSGFRGRGMVWGFVVGVGLAMLVGVF